MLEEVAAIGENFLHTLQDVARSPLFILRCLFKFERLVNLFLHILHEKGSFSSVYSELPA
jgi:hypothetical protein